MTFLSEPELKQIGFKRLGKNVKISAKASFHNPANISIGDNSRIDDYCVLSAGNGGIDIGRNVHISVHVSVIGSGKVVIGDFAGLSAKTAIFSSNDDYSGSFMTNPTVDLKFTNVTHKDVIIEKHALIGANSVILPGVAIGQGACIGALSLVKNNCKSFYMYGGIPAKILRKRSTKLLTLEKKLLKIEG